MRLSKFSGVLMMAVGSLPFACFDTDITCEDELTCPEGKGGTSGKGGSAGAAGSTTVGGASGEGNGAGGGAAGKGGIGGDAGDGGLGGAAVSGRGGAGGASGTSGAAGMLGGEGGDAGSGPSLCDPTSTPEEDACVVDEAYGVFVSPAGDNDGGDGSRAKPFATLAKAVEIAILEGKRVYACADEGAFAESVSLDATASGLALFGGFSCADWKYDALSKTAVESATPLALQVAEASDVSIQGFAFEAADGEARGESSVGAFVVNSTGVVLRRVDIAAGDGMDGAGGELELFGYPAQASLNGNAESPAMMGGAEKVCACQETLMSSGAVGGSPSGAGQAGGKGLPDHGAGAGGMPGPCGSGGGGDDGADAPNAPAAAGASTWGSADAAGWQPAPGVDGEIGQPGQGGGGGASRNNLGHGGGGGCGGCGGNGATKGFGGGGSIALLVVESEVALDQANLMAATAGHGGNGHIGQAGQQDVGIGGDTVSPLNSCPGGVGGRGGNGGASGGGAGGVSVGILWFGEAAPTQAGVTFIVGSAGEGGLGGEPGINDGIDGVAQAELEVP